MIVVLVVIAMMNITTIAIATWLLAVVTLILFSTAWASRSRS